ncbi:hypothetical protein HDU93_002597, partial [Gonapodya sp. JEL0774]
VPDVVDDSTYSGDAGPGQLIGDNLTIAEFLDARFPDKSSLFLPWLPLGTVPDTSSPEFAQAHTMARFIKEGLGNSDSQWASHFELTYEQLTDMHDDESRDYLRSDYKMGFVGAWDWLMNKDRAALLAQTRRSLLPLSNILCPQARPSLHAPGILDYIVFARCVYSRQCDVALNKGIWSRTGDAAREWLDSYHDGKWALTGKDREPGSWFGDVELPGVEDWVERMYDLHDGYMRKFVDGDKLPGEPVM